MISGSGSGAPCTSDSPGKPVKMESPEASPRERVCQRKPRICTLNKCLPIPIPSDSHGLGDTLRSKFPQLY